MIRRRTFIAGLGAAAAWPLAARAQQGALPVIGYLAAGGVPDNQQVGLQAFRAGLAEAGFIEGRNVAIVFRGTERYDELPILANDLVHDRVKLIVAVGGTPSAMAAKAATSTIPIVFANGGDPVLLGLAASLNRPGGNATGVSFLTGELVGKRLDLLRDLVPDAGTVAYLLDPRAASAEVSSTLSAAAGPLGRKIIAVESRSQSGLEGAFTAALAGRADAMIVGGYPLFISNREKLVTLAQRYRLPTMYYAREFVVDGGLISYGARIYDAYRLAGSYVAQILKGSNPAELPVQQSTRLELIINLKTAKALGLTVPESLLLRADEVIE